MPTLLAPVAIQQFKDNNGNSLIGGQLFTYQAGTSIPAPSYTDATGTSANSNPVILNSRGEAPLWLTPGQFYKLVLQDATGVMIWTADQVPGGFVDSASLPDTASSNKLRADLILTSDPTRGGSLVGFIGAGAGAVGRTVQAKERDVISVEDFGAVGDGVTDDTTAIQAAINSLAPFTILKFNRPAYLFTAIAIANKNNVTLDGASKLIGKLSITGSKGITVKNLTFDRGRTVFNADAIQLANSSSLLFDGLTFKGVDRCIYVMPVATVQHVNRVTITRCVTGITDSSLFTSAEISTLPSVYYSQGYPNYFFYADNANTGVPSQLQTGDVSITDCNPVAVNITHVQGLGVDGLLVSNNTFFHCGGFYRSQVKFHCIYMYLSTWASITNNHLFESGLETVFIERATNAVISHNIIAWPGQRNATRSAGIRISSDANDPYTSSNISNNLVRIPSGNGIVIDDNCNYVTINHNTVTTPGNNAQYYGDGTQPQGATAVPAITGTKYGIYVAPSCAQMSVVGNITALGANYLPRSYSTFNATALYNGPITNNNTIQAGNESDTLESLITTITANVVDGLGYDNMFLNVSAGGTINTIYQGKNGQRLIVFNGSSPVTFTHNTASIYLSGGVNMTLGYQKTLELKCVAGIWRELTRSV